MSGVQLPESYQTSEDDGEEAEEGDDVLVVGDRRLPEMVNNFIKKCPWSSLNCTKYFNRALLS